MDIYELVIAEEEYLGSKSEISEEGCSCFNWLELIWVVGYINLKKEQPYQRKETIPQFGNEFHLFIKNKNQIQPKNGSKVEVGVLGK